MAKTLLLDTQTWDLVLDASGDIAVASDPYSLAQDAASAIKLFQGELWYDTTQGVPYFAGILGTLPPVPLIKSKFVAAALTVPGVVSAQCFLSALSQQRQLSGQVQIKTTTGQISVVAFTQVNPAQIATAGKFKLDFSKLGGSDVLG